MKCRGLRCSVVLDNPQELQREADSVRAKQADTQAQGRGRRRRFEKAAFSLRPIEACSSKASMTSGGKTYGVVRRPSVSCVK